MHHLEGVDLLGNVGEQVIVLKVQKVYVYKSHIAIVITLFRYFGVLDFAIKDEGGGSSHVDVVLLEKVSLDRAVGLAPLDVEGSAVHDDVAGATGATGEAGGDGGGTGTGAAGLGDAAATLPDADADAAVSLHAGKLNVAALWECLMHLQYAPFLGHLIHIVRKYHVVRIAH
jgi:hypothetical protein